MSYRFAQMNTPCSAAQGSGWFSAAMACALMMIADIVIMTVSVVFFAVSGLDVRLCIIPVLVMILLHIQETPHTRKR